MGTSFYNDYYKYFLWNKALLAHLFSKKKREIFLYVDQQLLEEIGKEAGIEAENYKVDFFESVERFCGKYNKYSCLKRDPNSDKPCNHKDCTYYLKAKTPCLIAEYRSDVLSVANHICMSEMVYYNKYEDDANHIKVRQSENVAIFHQLPYLAIVVYVILKFDNGETQQWDNVGSSDKSRTYILALWNHIHEYDQRFDNEASVFDHTGIDRGDYAGRIKYHLPLSVSTRNKLRDAIYKSSAWKQVDNKSFKDLVGMILPSLTDVNANEELKKILMDLYTSKDQKSVPARNVMAVINDFDVDAYEAGMEKRKQTVDYNNTRISGKFALGIFMKEENQQKTTSMVLLTTVQQQIVTDNYRVDTGKLGTFDGYNTSFVELADSQPVQLQEYTLRDGNYNISLIPLGDVVLFYQYDEHLFIQTREIKPDKAYIIAVRNTAVTEFEKWLEDEHNNNNVERLPQENTRALFGNEWTIYCTGRSLNGQYYKEPVNEESSSTESSSYIVMKGGIKKNSNFYFINALPYFEVPGNYNPEEVAISINCNGYEFTDYTTRCVDNKIILDIHGMPLEYTETPSVDILLECTQKVHSNFSFCVCGQPVSYNENSIYRFDRFGNKVDADGDYYVNHVRNEFRLKNVDGVYHISTEALESIEEEFYFTNLFAACCYSSENTEISKNKFEKCVRYSATHLNIDVNSINIKKLKRMMCDAGILQIDYGRDKYQAIPPSFMRVPFSFYASKDSQLIMLSGCYTRKLIADLYNYCHKHQVTISVIKQKDLKGAEKFLPPIVLLGHNFDPNRFYEIYNQQCDILTDHDFALFLLNLIPEYDTIKSQFSFVKKDSETFAAKLHPSNIHEDIKSYQVTNGNTHWYIVGNNNEYAEVTPSLLPWASIYCARKSGMCTVIIQNNSVYIPKSLLLSNYIRRALYLMNLGLPTSKKVFVCGNPDDYSFLQMYQYNLHSQDRCKALASKLAGEIKTSQRTELKMEEWIPSFNGKKYNDSYIILRENQNIRAVVVEQKVYVHCDAMFKRINATSVNEVLSYLITEEWQICNQGQSIGTNRDSGQQIDVAYDLSNELIELPDETKYKKETIQIL